VDIKFPKHLSPEIQNFISKLLVRKPEDRMSLGDALHHPWLMKYEQKKQ